MTLPSADDQVRFLLNVQRLLREGQFTSTYKYALLLAIADISVETGDDSGDPLPVSLRLISEKIISYYWRQSMPFLSGSEPAPNGPFETLRQITSQSQAKIITRVAQSRRTSGNSLQVKKSTAASWDRLVKDVAAVIRQMPLYKLQVVGRETLSFLYEHKVQDGNIVLLPGVAYCLRRFHGLLTEMVSSAWANFVRRHNAGVLGTTSDLMSFLFGNERTGLSNTRAALIEAQEGKCLYCARHVREETGHVDHFIPWSLYPLNLGHNFVWVHPSCNLAKSDRLASEHHLESWLIRNQSAGSLLESHFNAVGIAHNSVATVSVAEWAYALTAGMNGLVWTRGKELVALTGTWRNLIGSG